MVKRNTGTRKKMLAKVHIAKKELLADDDDVYRHWIRTISKGRTDSSADLTERELDALIRKFKSFGWKDNQKARVKAMKAEVLKAAKENLGENWVMRLKGLCQKVAGTEAVEWVNDAAKLKRLLGIIRNIRGEN